jgi:hypothetical protein
LQQTQSKRRVDAGFPQVIHYPLHRQGVTVGAFRVVLTASFLAATVQAAPVPLPRQPRNVPAPETVLARLRAEGLDVRGLTHHSGSCWVSETAFDISDSIFPPRVVRVKRTIIAPGDPTDKLREFLRKK